MKTVNYLLLLSAFVLLVGLSYIASRRFGTVEVHGHTQSIADKPQSVQLLPIARRHEYSKHDIANFAYIGDKKIWAVGYDEHDPRKIFYSNDGGRTWEARSVKTNGFTFEGISFSDSQNGWAVGGYGLIIHTANAGESWKQIKSPTKADLSVVHFLNSKVGYIAGSNASFDEKNRTTTYGIEILRTTDGGLSWQPVYRDDESRTVFQLEALSESTIMAVIDGRFLLRTEDNGSTWQTLNVPVGGPMGIKYTSDGTLWVVGDKGCFYRSADQGKSWQSPANFPQSLLRRYWWSIDFADANRGVAVGDDGAWATTSDGGATWSECQTDVKDHLRKIKFYDGSGIILGAQKIYEVNLNAETRNPSLAYLTMSNSDETAEGRQR